MPGWASSWVAPCAVALLALLPYLPGLARGEFLDYDDPYLISRNPVMIEAPLGALLDPTGDRSGFGSEYLPLRDLSYRLDAALWGTGPAAARGFRLTNLLLYGLACACATRLLVRLGRAATGRSAWPASAALLGGLLFAWHPAHAESAAWIAGRKDVLSGALALAALLAWLRARERPRPDPRWEALTALLALGACLSKGTAVALPVLALACELLASARGPARPWTRRARDLAPLVLVCGASALLHAWVGGRSGVRQPDRPLAIVLLADLPVLRRYLVTSLVPWRLAVDHGPFVQALRLRPDALSWPSPLLVQAGLSLLALGPLALAALRARASWPRWALVWGLGGLLPVLNLVPIPHWVADRFLFLPLLAPCLLLALLVGRAGRLHPLLGALLGLGLALGFGALTLRRGLELSTSQALWRAELSRRPGDPHALRHLGQALLEASRDARDPARRAALEAEGLDALEASLPAFAALLVPSGHEAEAWLLLAQARAERGELGPARAALSEAGRRFPGDPRPWLLLGALERRAGGWAPALEALTAAAAALRAQRGPPEPRQGQLRALRAELDRLSAAAEAAGARAVAIEAARLAERPERVAALEAP